jgi:hypothetical protein
VAERVRGLEPRNDGQPSWSDERDDPLGARWERIICSSPLLHLDKLLGGVADAGSSVAGHV